MKKLLQNSFCLFLLTAATACAWVTPGDVLRFRGCWQLEPPIPPTSSLTEGGKPQAVLASRLDYSANGCVSMLYQEPPPQNATQSATDAFPLLGHFGSFTVDENAKTVIHVLSGQPGGKIQYSYQFIDVDHLKLILQSGKEIKKEYVWQRIGSGCN